jgi:hypothetical protein
MDNTERKEIWGGIRTGERKEKIKEKRKNKKEKIIKINTWR